MTKSPLVWTADDALNHTFSAQVANITYHVATQDYGYPAHVEARGPRGGLKKTVRAHRHDLQGAKNNSPLTGIRPSKP
jgi:hypothetical protein